jgi:hypothetical protein
MHPLKVRFALDSSLEEAVSSEPVSVLFAGLRSHFFTAYKKEGLKRLMWRV